MNNNPKNIFYLFFGLFLFFLMDPCKAQSAKFNLNNKWYSPGLGFVVEFSVENDSVTWKWINKLNDSLTSDPKRPIKTRVKYKRNLYLIYEFKNEYPGLDTQFVYFFFGLKRKSDSCMAIADIETLNYACISIECAKNTIRSKKCGDRELPYIDYYPADLINKYSSLRNFKNIDSAQTELVFDCLIKSKQNLYNSFSRTAIEKLDSYFFPYHVAKALVMAGFNPLKVSYDDFENFIKASLQNEYFKKKYEKYQSL